MVGAERRNGCKDEKETCREARPGGRHRSNLSDGVRHEVPPSHSRDGGHNMACVRPGVDPLPPLEDDAIDPASAVVRHVERPVWTLGDAYRTMPRVCRK